jgi:predicted phosphodiesterase
MALCAKYGIIADIHSNYTALKVALDYLQRAGVDKVLCLGDIVGQVRDASECIQALKHRSDIFVIAGNCDRAAAESTVDDISPANRRFLKALPEGMTIDETFMMVHGSIVNRDAYILNAQEISRNLSCMINDFPTIKACFFGHTHIPMLINTKQVITDLRETKTFQLDPKDVYLINPGSVGQPRDKCPLAAFGIFNAENWQMQFIRKPYDYNSTGSESATGPLGPIGYPVNRLGSPSVYPINRLGDWKPKEPPEA